MRVCCSLGSLLFLFRSKSDYLQFFVDGPFLFIIKTKTEYVFAGATYAIVLLFLVYV